MNLSISFSIDKIRTIKKSIYELPFIRLVLIISVILAVSSTLFYLSKDLIVAYGDAESHLNIAKRVIHSITPGFAQLGGIWLPIPHILMIPLVFFDPLWRSGLAGSIVSGTFFIISSIFLYKLAYMLTHNKLASFVAFFVFVVNPNILYLQSTPMTELPLVGLFILSTYFFVRFIKDESHLPSLLLASFFGFLAVLTRYDGWFLVMFEAFTILLLYFNKKESFRQIEGKFILFSTLAFFGIALWMVWDFLILGDPFYFTNSQFSARTQQMNWLARGELPAYQNIFLSFAYYFVTTMSNGGLIVFLVGIIGLILYLKNKNDVYRYLVSFVLLVPFVFNVFTLFMGQSVIFIPHLTPVGFEWRLFNVRYGVLMIPVLAIFFGYVFSRCRRFGAKFFIIFLILVQFGLYGVGYSKVISLADGTEGLSKAKIPDAEYFVKKHYDNGLVLIDDYARTLSIIRSGIPMQNIIYIGNKPYWEESLAAPERYATWIIMQKNDDVWKNIFDKPAVQGRLYKYFQKVYTSPNILIFKKK